MVFASSRNIIPQRCPRGQPTRKQVIKVHYTERNHSEQRPTQPRQKAKLDFKSRNETGKNSNFCANPISLCVI